MRITGRKALGYRLFRLGAMPRDLLAALRREGLVVWDEGLPGAMITTRLRGPGHLHRHRAEGFSGFLAVSRRRILACSYRRRQINIGCDDPRLRELYVRCPKPDRVELSFEAGRFREDWQGVIRLRFTTPRARVFERTLLAAGCSPGLAGAGSR